MKPKKGLKNKDLRGRTLSLSGGKYYRGQHGEIRAESPKLHLSKKQRRKLTKMAKERAKI